jgi:hypothetical protein
MLAGFSLGLELGDACLQRGNKLVHFSGGQVGSDVFRAIPVVGNDADADDALGDLISSGCAIHARVPDVRGRRALRRDLTFLRRSISHLNL